MRVKFSLKGSATIQGEQTIFSNCLDNCKKKYNIANKEHIKLSSKLNCNKKTQLKYAVLFCKHEDSEDLTVPYAAFGMPCFHRQTAYRVSENLESHAMTEGLYVLLIACSGAQHPGGHVHNPETTSSRGRIVQDQT